MELHFLHFLDMTLSRNRTFRALTTTEDVTGTSSSPTALVLTRFMIASNYRRSSSLTWPPRGGPLRLFTSIDIFPSKYTSGNAQSSTYLSFSMSP
jgi:hypothetical protein